MQNLESVAQKIANSLLGPETKNIKVIFVFL